jgi:cytoskeletal protein RodZ
MEDNQVAPSLTLETLGEMLKAQRLSACLSVEDTARKLLLSPAQLEGLEQGDLKPFYSAYYYQRAVAKYLQLFQLEVDLTSLQLPVHTAIPTAVKPGTGVRSKRPVSTSSRGASFSKVLIASVLLLMAISTAGFFVWKNQNAQLKAVAINPPLETTIPATPVAPADGAAAAPGNVAMPVTRPAP